MNEIMRRLLEKVSVEELYDEIKLDDTLMYNLSMWFIKNNKKVFIQTMRGLFKGIVEGNNTPLKEELKQYILNMDGEYEFSINKKKKARASTVTTKSTVASDPCARVYKPTNGC